MLRPRNGDPSYFDPIATLGADSPRLPLPVARYQSTQESDVECVGVYSISSSETERYMMDGMGGFSGVGQGNTFIPGSMQKDRYEPPQQPQGMQPGTGTSQLMPDDVKAIVNAIMQTPQMQWVAEQMEAGMGSGSQMAQQNPMQQQPQAQMPGPMPSQYAAPVASPMSSPTMYSQQNPVQYSAGDSQEDEVDRERYAQIENELIESRDRYSQLMAQNETLANAHKELFQQHASLHKRFIEQEQRLVDADRYSQIKSLHDRYDLIDTDTEAERCLYSKGSKMTDEEFTAHLSYVEKYAAKAQNRPPVGMIPDGVAPSRPVDSAMEEKISTLVVDRYTQKASRGEIASYDSVRAEVVKELGLN